MSWKTVEIIAEPGTQFGILESEGDKLVIVTRRKKTNQNAVPWPNGIKDAAVKNKGVIGPGMTKYIVTSGAEPDVAKPRKESFADRLRKYLGN